MTYLLKRGKGSSRRKAHLCTFDRLGNATMRPLCGRVGLRFDLTSNVPWGPLCKHCRALVVPVHEGCQP